MIEVVFQDMETPNFFFEDREEEVKQESLKIIQI